MIELTGELVRLRTTVAEDRDALVAIRQTPEVSARWRGDDVGAEFARDLVDDEEQQLTVEDRHGRVIGLIQFSEENEPDYRHATIDIYLEPRIHRRGFGVDAIRTLVRYLLVERGHHRLTIDPAVNNAGAIASYERVGFRRVGVMRCYERAPDGSWRDALLLDLLADELVRSPERHAGQSR